MRDTKTFAIDNGGPYAVIAPIDCDRIEVRENYNSANPPTADLQQFGQTPGSTAVAIPKGTSAIFTKGSRYAAGEVAGYINTASGSITVAQLSSSTI